MSALHNWYLNQLKKSAEGFRLGAGIPSPQEAATGAQLFGLALTGDPGARHAMSQMAKQTAQGLGTMATHPLQTGTALLSNLQSTPPPETGGFLAGIMAPFGKYPAIEKLSKAARDPKAMRYGQYIMHRAERRMDARVAAERTRATQEARKLAGGSPMVEGSIHETMAGREHLVDFGGGDLRLIESFGDEIIRLRGLPNETLLQSYKSAMLGWKAAGDLPNDYQRAMLREMSRRGIKLDISDELHILHEGKPPVNDGGITPPLNIWTREERGGKMLRNVDFTPPTTQQHARQNVANFLNTNRPNDPVGTKIGKFIKLTKGWTYLE